MSALAISSIACAIMLCGAAGGVVFRKVLPEHHLNAHSKDIVRAGSALIATISALVLGLLITSAKNTFDTQRNEVREITAKFILVDSQLKRYGPESRQARELLRQSVDLIIDRIWGERAVKAETGAPFQPSKTGDLLYAAIAALSPQNDGQRALKAQSLQTAAGITEERVLLFEQSDAGLPTPLLAVVIFWLTILLASFTLFSPVNPTGGAALLIIAVSASGAVFLILEMNTPFTGVMQISSNSLRAALGVLG